MKKCNNCNKIFQAEGNFCADCGAPLMDIVVCPNCGKEIENESASFCFDCGAKLNGSTEDKKANFKDTVQSSVDKLKESEFVKSVKNDLQNSQSVSLIKNKAIETANTVKIKAATATGVDKSKVGLVAAIMVVVIVIIGILANIRTCDECNKTYVGKKHTVSFWGETENLCKDCYDDFYR